MLSPKVKLSTDSQAESGQDVTPNNMKSTQERLKEETTRSVISKHRKRTMADPGNSGVTSDNKSNAQSASSRTGGPANAA